MGGRWEVEEGVGWGKGRGGSCSFYLALDFGLSCLYIAHSLVL